MRKLLIAILALGLPLSAAKANQNTWVKVTDDKTIEHFLLKDKTWADTLMQAMGTSGSGGVTGMQVYMLGGSGSGGVTGGDKLLGGGGGIILPGIYKIDSQHTFEILSDAGVTPNEITAEEFYKVMTPEGIEQMGFFTGKEWIVSE